MRQVEIWTLTVYWMILRTMTNFWSGVNWYLWLCFSKNNLCFRDSYWNTGYKVISCLGFVSRSSLGYRESGGGVDEAGLAMSWQYWSCVMGPAGLLHFFCLFVHVWKFARWNLKKKLLMKFWPHLILYPYPV